MMEKKRLRLGVVFNFSSKWMGGVIYVINLVKTLNKLPDNDKPEIFLFYNSELTKFLDEFDYPYLTSIEWDFPSVIKGNLKSWLLRKNCFYDELIRRNGLDSIYPAKNFPVKSKSGAKVIAWFADLQHKYYPEYFSKWSIMHRNIRLHFMLRNADDLIVSSNSVKNDFYKFFKVRKGLKFHVFHFTSINDDFQVQDFEILKSKYNIPSEYFMISNQFHKHKNHRAALLALAELKQRGIKKHYVITGKFPEAEESPYLKELHEIINKNELHDQISLLGIISRDDQINLMKNAQAVLQPSLFEGWSTVIEDAISLQVPVIASNLDVNIEQLEDKGVYFSPHDYKQLAEILENHKKRDMNEKPYEDYSNRISKSLSVLLKALI